MVNTQKTYPLHVVVGNASDEPITRITEIEATFDEGSPLTSEQIDLKIVIEKNTYDESGYTVNTPTVALVSSSGMSVDSVEITPADGDYNYSLSFVVKKTTLDATFGQLVITCSQGSSAHDKVNYLIDITAPVTTEKIKYIEADDESVETINTNQSYTDLRNDIKTRATSVKPSNFYETCNGEVPDEDEHVCLTELHVKVELQRTIFPQFYDEDDTEKFLFKCPVEETVGPVLLSKFNPLVITDDVGMNVLTYTLVDSEGNPLVDNNGQQVDVQIVKTLMIKPKITVEETGSEGLLEYYSGSMADATYPYDIYVTVNRKNSEEIMDPIVTTEYFKDKITVDFTDQTLTEDSDSSEKAYIMSDKMSDGQVVSTEQPYVTVISNKYGDLGLDMATKVFKMTFDNVSRIADLYIKEAGTYHNDHNEAEAAKNEADTALEHANAQYELAVSDLETAKTTKEENERAFDNATHAVNDAQLKVDALTQDKATLKSNLEDVENQVLNNDAKLGVDHSAWTTAAADVSDKLDDIVKTYNDTDNGIIKNINDARGVVDTMVNDFGNVDENGAVTINQDKLEDFSTFSTEIKEYLTTLEGHLETANERDTALTGAISYTTRFTEVPIDNSSSVEDRKTELETLETGDADSSPPIKSLSQLNTDHSAAQATIASFMDNNLNHPLKTALNNAETALGAPASDDGNGNVTDATGAYKDLATEQAAVVTEQAAVAAAEAIVAEKGAAVAEAQVAVTAATAARDAATATRDAAETALGAPTIVDGDGNVTTAATGAYATLETAQGELGAPANGDESATGAYLTLATKQSELTTAQVALESAQAKVNAVTAARVTVLEKEAALEAAQAAVDALGNDGEDGNPRTGEYATLDEIQEAVDGHHATYLGDPTPSNYTLWQTTLASLNSKQEEITNTLEALGEPAIVDENGQVTTEATGAYLTLATAQGELTTAEGAEPAPETLTTLETTRNEKQAALVAAQGVVAEKEAAVAGAQAAVDAATTAVDAAQAAVDAAQAAVTTASNDLGTPASVNNEGTEIPGTGLIGQLETAQSQLATAVSQLQGAQTAVDAAQTALDAAQDKVTTAQANYDAEIQRLRNAVEDAQKEVNTRINDINAKRSELTEALELQSKYQDYVTESDIESALDGIKSAAEGVDIGASLDVVTNLRDQSVNFDDAADAQSDALQALLTNFVQSLANESSRLDTLSANTKTLASNFAALKTANDNLNTEMSAWLGDRETALTEEKGRLATLLSATKEALHRVYKTTLNEDTGVEEETGLLPDAEELLAAAQADLDIAKDALGNDGTDGNPKTGAHATLAEKEAALAEKEAELGNDGTNGNPKTGAHATLADAQQAYEEAYSNYSKLHRLIKNTTGLDTDENPLYVSFMSDVISTPDYVRYLVNHKYSSTVSDLKLQHNGSDSNNNILDISFTSSNDNPEKFVIDVTTDSDYGIENLIMKEFESSVTPQFIDTDSLMLPNVTRNGFEITLDSNLPASYLLTMSVAQETELIRELTLEKLIDREETFIVNVGYELAEGDGKLSCLLKTVGADTPGQKNSTDVKVNDCREYEFVDENKLLNDLFEHLQYSDTVIKTHTKSQMGGLIEHFVKIKNVTISDGDDSVPLYNEDVYANAKTFNTVELSTFGLDNPDKLSVTLHYISQGNTKQLKEELFEFTIGGQLWTGSDESHIRLKYVEAPKGNTFDGFHEGVSLIDGGYFKYNKKYCAKPGELLYSAPSIPNVRHTHESWLASTHQTDDDGNPVNNCYAEPFDAITFINNYNCQITLQRDNDDQVTTQDEWNFIAEEDGITYSVTRTIPSIVPGTELRGHSVDEAPLPDGTPELTPDPNKTITTTYEVEYTDKQGFRHIIICCF